MLGARLLRTRFLLTCASVMTSPHSCTRPLMIQFVPNVAKPSVSQAHAYFMARDIWALDQDLFEEPM